MQQQTKFSKYAFGGNHVEFHMSLETMMTSLLHLTDPVNNRRGN